MSNDKGTPAVFGMCAICGNMYPIEGANDPGICGSSNCQAIKNNSRVVATPVYGSNVNIITYNEGLGSPSVSTSTDLGIANVTITKEVDTQKKDIENDEKIEKEFKNRFGKKTAKKKGRTAKKA